MSLQKLLAEVRACNICEQHLSHGVNPVLAAKSSAKILIIGQAPGIKVHQSNITWNDKSGERLRDWLGIDAETFYNEKKIAMMPMGFCYPGKDKSGDLPPRKECAEHWHGKILRLLPKVKLTILIGQYAQNYYLKKDKRESLTETVRSFGKYLPTYFPLPHPSPRNFMWYKRNGWFEDEVLAILKSKMNEALNA